MNRFLVENQTALDTHTGLMWTINASLFDFSMTWTEALQAVKELNNSKMYGYADWKIPNRRELFSLLSHKIINPCLPTGHPFLNVFTSYYWTSTTCIRIPKQAWYIHLGGARVFKGVKNESHMVWPVRVCANQNKTRLLETGQITCFDTSGTLISCLDTGQDGEKQTAAVSNKDRFIMNNDIVYDHVTRLSWLRNANIYNGMLDWNSAFEFISIMNAEMKHGYNDWRIPNIIELEGLIDLSQNSPALSSNHSFVNVQDFYWSSTTSAYEPKYAWALYMQDGAIGVGYKTLSEFYLWPVRGEQCFIQ